MSVKSYNDFVDRKLEEGIVCIRATRKSILNNNYEADCPLCSKITEGELRINFQSIRCSLKVISGCEHYIGFNGAPMAQIDFQFKESTGGLIKEDCQ